MTLAEARAEVLQSIRDGEHEMEAGYPYHNNLNDRQRQVIQAMADENSGECWLAKVNLYRYDPDYEHKRLHPLWKWDGGLVYNFGSSFVLPRYDAEFERLLVERNTAEYTTTTEDYRRIQAIYKRAEEVGAEILIWN